MIRFTIRDLVWLRVVVALGVAWWVDRSRLNELANLTKAVQAYKRSTGGYPPNLSAPAPNLPEENVSLPPPPR